jgi:hypothetical protein
MEFDMHTVVMNMYEYLELGFFQIKIYQFTIFINISEGVF